MTRSGLTLLTTPSIISLVSIPVMPNTPGDKAQTDLTPSFICSGKNSVMCLVTIIFSITLGPKASGVIFQFPKPTTKITELSLSLTRLISSLANALLTSSIKSISFSFSLGTSKVM
ncbi:hypothetical protein SDC9_168507 [bioreactor metagenome]|uniref:Uncharacterized protein n=1 Tax=bioreactor metagenome TaxID=1076179 RepID=A0A645G2Q0_9ZZZZ